MDGGCGREVEAAEEFLSAGCPWLGRDSVCVCRKCECAQTIGGV